MTTGKHLLMTARARTFVDMLDFLSIVPHGQTCRMFDLLELRAITDRPEASDKHYDLPLLPYYTLLYGVKLANNLFALPDMDTYEDLQDEGKRKAAQKELAKKMKST